jgi:hypothetical protein
MKTYVRDAVHKRFTGRRLFRQGTASFLVGTRAGAAWEGFKAPNEKWLKA